MHSHVPGILPTTSSSHISRTVFRTQKNEKYSPKVTLLEVGRVQGMAGTRASNQATKQSKANKKQQKEPKNLNPKMQQPNKRQRTPTLKSLQLHSHNLHPKHSHEIRGGDLVNVMSQDDGPGAGARSIANRGNTTSTTMKPSAAVVVYWYSSITSISNRIV